MPGPGGVRPYRGRFSTWDAEASVRAKPILSIDGNRPAHGLFFSPELVPIARHPLVVRRGPRATEIVLARHLVHHLDFTDALENVVVTPVAYNLGRGALDLQLSTPMRLDARRIAVDEMHHALCAASIAEDIALAADIQRPDSNGLPLLEQLQSIVAGSDAQLAPLLMTFFAVVSETLITSTLSEVPTDARVLPQVRQVLGDHAEDETRHHAFFADFFAVAWPQLSDVQQRAIGPLLPRFISIFLGFDKAFDESSLRLIGLDEPEIRAVIEDSYADPELQQRGARHAAATVRYFRRAGLLDNQEIADAFFANGLAGT